MKHRLFLLEPGLKLTLAADWTFALTVHWRNRTLREALGLPTAYSAPDQQVTLPAETVLIVHSLRIVRGGGTSNRVSFAIAADGCPRNPQLAKTWFRASLSDVKTIVWEDGLEEGAAAAVPQYDPEDA